MPGLTLKQIQDRALKLMDEWIGAGVYDSNSPTLDYLARFPDLIDQCVNEISDYIGIAATVTVDANTPIDSTEDGLSCYKLPADLKRFRYIKYAGVRLASGFEVEDGLLKLDPIGGNAYTIHYYRFPTQITDETADEFVPDVDPSTHYLIPYYIGGTVLMSASEDTQLGGKLLNYYAARLQGLTKLDTRAPRTGRDVVRW